MIKKNETTPRIVAMLETGVAKESSLDRLLNKSREFANAMLTCFRERLKLVDLIRKKYMPLQRKLKKNQAALYDDLVLDKPAEVCQQSAQNIEAIERQISQVDVMDKTPILKNLETVKAQQIQQVQTIVDQETENVVDIEQNQLHQVKEEIAEIQGKMSD